MSVAISTIKQVNPWHKIIDSKQNLGIISTYSEQNLGIISTYPFTTCYILSNKWQRENNKIITACTHMHLHVVVYTYARTQTYTHACAHAHTRTCTQSYIHKCTHAQARAHAHTHICSKSQYKYILEANHNMRTSISQRQSHQRKWYSGLESPKLNVITGSNCLRIVRMLATLHLATMKLGLVREMQNSQLVVLLAQYET